jgi:hypothetical protein
MMRGSCSSPAYVVLTALAFAAGATQAGDDAVATEQTFDLTIVGPDQKPVAGASVQLRTRPALRAEDVQRGQFIGGDYWTVVKADANGQIVIKLPNGATALTFDITTPGYAPYWASWQSNDHPQPIPAKFTAQLDAAWSIGGIIIDENARPVQGAVVHPWIAFKTRPGDQSELYSGDELKTDAAGRWRFDSVPVALQQLRVEVMHPDFAVLRRGLARSQFEIKPDEQPTETIPLARGLVVTGKITDDQGNPIAGALVRSKFSNDRREAKTNDAGVYQLVGCEPRMVKIVASAKGRAIDMQEVRIEPDMKPIDFQLKPGGHVRIRVLDEKGNGIPKARIFFQGWRGGYDYFEFNVNQSADANGVWEWNEAPTDGFLADICPPDGMQLSRQLIVAREEEYVFRPPPALVITGKVVDADTKEPIKAFRVVPGIRGSPAQMNWVPSQIFDASDGQFSMRRTHNYFAWLARIEAPGYLPAVSRDIKSDEGNVTLDFELKKGKDVAASLLTPDGKPAAKAKIALGVAGSQISIKNGDFAGQVYGTRLDADDAGRFSIPPPGSAFELVVLHPTGYAHVKSGGEPVSETIQLTAWAKVEGTYRVGSRAVAGAPIEMEVNALNSFGRDGARIYSSYEATTGADGRFVFDRVAAGRGWISRELKLTVNDGAIEPMSTVRHMTSFAAGETHKLDLGGTGTTVTGKLLPPEGFKGPARWNFGLLTARLDLPQELRDTSPYIMATIGRDGSFRIDDMPAGDYTMSIRFDRDPVGSLGEYRFVVPPADAANPDRPHDLGMLRLER